MSGSHSRRYEYQRRDFLRGASSLGAAALLGLPAPVSAEPPPETKKIRLVDAASMCLAPQYIAEDLLRAEGFTESGNGDDRLFISSMLAYVGVDPTRDIKWLTSPKGEQKRLFVEGKADAFLAFPPEPQELRAKKIGRVFLSTVNDRPWSQYFCCMVAGNREFVRKYPVATKRVLRAYLKAADICANDPGRAARYMVDKGYVQEFKYALEIVTELPIAGGARRNRRIRCGSTRCVCKKRGSSSQARRRSSLKARTGGF
jgi:hypothetical protein